MKLEKVLVVDSDVDIIQRMQQMLPEDVEVELAGQAEARHLGVGAGVDLIILDNDANDMQKSQGQETLVKIREKKFPGETPYKCRSTINLKKGRIW